MQSLEAPLPPEILMSALQDTLHVDLQGRRSVRPAKNHCKKTENGVEYPDERQRQ